MAISKDREEAIRKFMLDKLWPAYPSDLTEGKKGSRGEALKCIIRKAPSDEELERILRNLEAQKKYDRALKESGGFVYRWPFMSTYINQMRYDDEIQGAHSELKKQDLSKCEKCDREVHGPKFKFCTEHLAESTDTGREKRIEALKRAGLYIEPGESKQEYFNRCRDFCRQALNSGKNRNTIVS